ncbi:MAG: protein kinase [Minicystis sp.]
MSQSPYRPGDVFIGKYRVERVLGAGNMGLVLSATHIGLDQRVAIKFMLPGKAPEEQHQRFLREARACARLKSQHVAKVLDVGTTPDGAPYMIMEYLDGCDLAAELSARGPLPYDEAVGHVLQACEAIAEAHAAGIVHRDIKPANMFLTRGPDGAPCVKVLDFGISKMRDANLALTGDMQALGSPLYMSPEQMDSAKEVDARTDVWALGVTLYELVAGKTPFHATKIEELCTRVFMKPPTPLSTYRGDAPAGFEAVLFQCLEKDRDRRWPNVAALAAALAPYAAPRAAAYVERIAGVLGEQVVPARRTDVLPPEPPARAAAPEAGTGGAVVLRPAVVAPSTGRGRAAAVVGGGLGVVVLGVLLLVGWRARTAPPGPASQVSTVPLPAASSVALPVVLPRAAEGERAPADAGATVASASAPAPSAIVTPPRQKPAGTAPPRTLPAKPAPTAAEQTPTPKPHKDPYAQ